MSDSAISPTSNVLAAWGTDLHLAICERCDWQYLLPSILMENGEKLPRCPHCFQAVLTPLTGEDPESSVPPCSPEFVLPFKVSDQTLDAAIRQFADGIPYAPESLHYATLRARLHPVYLPMWLADAETDAVWQADAGFDYQVVSHQERYGDNGGWKTQQVKEDRVRWEQRVGRIRRTFHNVSAPALEDAPALKHKLGDFQMDQPEPYRPEHLQRASVRLPDRLQDDAWSDAAAAFQSMAAGEVQRACAADHVRQFRWTAKFSQINWTLLLQPAYTTYYLDDAQQPQPVLIHGQTGRVTGARRASMQRAQRTSLIFLGVGLFIFLLGLIMGAAAVAIPPLGPLAIVALVIGIPCSLAALIPIGIAWDFNRKQNGR